MAFGACAVGVAAIHSDSASKAEGRGEEIFASSPMLPAISSKHLRWLRQQSCAQNDRAVTVLCKKASSSCCMPCAVAVA